MTIEDERSSSASGNAKSSYKSWGSVRVQEIVRAQAQSKKLKGAEQNKTNKGNRLLCSGMTLPSLH